MSSERAINEDALKDVDFDAPEPIGAYKFLQDRITNVSKNSSYICDNRIADFIGKGRRRGCN